MFRQAIRWIPAGGGRQAETVLSRPLSPHCVCGRLSLDSWSERFLERDGWRGRIFSFFFYAFRKLQRTFHDGRTAASDGVSAGQRGVEYFRESGGMAGARISACS